MADRRDEWFADTEGNLSPADDPLRPETDEFGRDDPAAIERERRRREREQRRRGSGGKAPSDGGALGRLFGGRGKRKVKPDERGGEPAPEPTADPGPEPTAERPSRRRARPRAEAGETAPRRGLGERAAAGREALRGRFGRDREAAAEPPRRRPPGDRPTAAGNPYRRRRIAALALALVGVLALWFLVSLFQPPPFDPGEGGGEVVVTVPEGASADQVADVLTENDVVSNGSLFQLRLRLAGKSESVGAGRFVMASGMSYGAAIDRLTQTGGKVTLTVPEGLPRDQIAPIASEAGLEGDYMAATQTPPQGFNPRRYGAPKPNLEGFLFPATYELDPNAPVQELVSQQLEAFEQNFAGVNLSFAKKKNLTAYDVLIIASMIDREVQIPKERPLVAAVIYNRLSKGMPLGIDATTRYETKNYTEPIQQATFEKNTPYNTRLNAGLTPTPIGNPGLDAIKAAARPAKVNHLFYVVKPGTCGEHSFTASEQEFERLAAEYQRALEEEGGSPDTCPE
jgi:UPF0755 protein